MLLQCGMMAGMFQMHQALPSDVHSRDQYTSESYGPPSLQAIFKTESLTGANSTKNASSCAIVGWVLYEINRVERAAH